MKNKKLKSPVSSMFSSRAGSAAVDSKPSSPNISKTPAKKSSVIDQLKGAVKKVAVGDKTTGESSKKLSETKKAPKDNKQPTSRPDSPLEMHTCQYCERKFSIQDNRHLKHEKVCATAKKKDKSRELKRKKEEKEKAKQWKPPTPEIKKADWRKTHGNLFVLQSNNQIENFLAAIRAAKSVK